MNKRFNLSSQEYCVLELLSKGFSYKLIAKKLEISPHTVNGHLKSIYLKWDVNSRGAAQNRFNQYLSEITTNELVSQKKDKAARASELVTANIELLFQTEEKSKRADELVIANADKAARASELAIASSSARLLFSSV
jgi:DNA-binding CsgD family transcriptional regulator